MGLFSPAWMSKNEKKALACLNGLTQEQLARAAAESKHESVRSAAMEKLTDQKVLFQLAKATGRGYFGESSNVSLAAARRITDGAYLRELATGHPNDDMRRAAAGQITDPSLLYQIALNDNDEFVRSKAVSRLKDQQFLTKLLQNTSYSNVRSFCLMYCETADDAVLENIALHDEDESVRIMAAKRIDAPEILERIALAASYTKLCTACLEKRGGQMLQYDNTQLAYIAEHSEFDVLRKAAVERIDDRAVLARIALTEKKNQVRRLAIEKVKDQSVLMRIAETDREPQLRNVAVEGLVDQEMLSRIALTSKDSTLRVSAIKKSADQAMLSELLCHAPEKECRTAAFKKLSGQELEEATVSYITENVEYDDAAKFLKELYKHREDMRPMLLRAVGKTYKAHSDGGTFNLSDCTSHHSDRYEEQTLEF